MAKTKTFSGSNLRRFRLEKGWTQAELADRAGIRRERQIIRWELGQNEPRIDAAANLATALGVSVDALFSSDEPQEAAPSGDTFRGGGARRGTAGTRAGASEASGGRGVRRAA